MQTKFDMRSFNMKTHLIKEKLNFFEKNQGDDAEVVQCPFNLYRIVHFIYMQDNKLFQMNSAP